MKLYTEIVVAILVIAGLFGFVLPQLVSARDDLKVIAGFALFVIAVPIMYFRIRNIVKLIIKLIKDYEEN